MATNNLPDPVVINPIGNQIVSINAADSIFNLTNYFDDPLTTGRVAHFNLANTSAGAIANGVINVVLFDQTGVGAPLTVQNFQNYVSASSYTNSFIHRSIPNFIIQGGGFTYNNSTLATIPTNAPVQNEFSALRSNLRGTISMAKLGSDPNSATDQWFFNLADNSSNLNNQNGGFTVFGQALGASDLATIDAIAAVTTYQANTTTFTNLPLTQPAISDTNFIRFSSITVTQEDELTFAIVGNTKPTLVTSSINNKQLVLDYLPNQTGSSDITIRATNLFGESIDYKFITTVLPNITLAISPANVTEDETANLIYTLTRNGDLSSSLTANYSVAGTATFATDYTQSGATTFTATTGTVTFAAGASTATVTIDPTADTTIEPDETVALTLAAGTGYTITNPTPVIGAIANDDISKLQIITSLVNLTAKPSQTISIPLFYKTSTADNTLTGVSLCLHYNSASLSYQNTTNLFSAGLSNSVFDNADTQNYDGDTSTDRYLELQYSDVTENWLNQTLPLKLGDFNFTSQSNFAGTKLNVTSLSTSLALGYSLQATSILVRNTPWTLDIDGNGTIGALSDGIMAVRYMFDSAFAGNALINGAIAPNATRNLAGVQSYLSGLTTLT